MLTNLKAVCYKSPTIILHLCFHLTQVCRKLNEIQIMWVPGHKGIQGNEIEDRLARIHNDMTCAVKWISLEDLKKYMNEKVHELVILIPGSLEIMRSFSLILIVIAGNTWNFASLDEERFYFQGSGLVLFQSEPFFSILIWVLCFYILCVRFQRYVNHFVMNLHMNDSSCSGSS